MPDPLENLVCRTLVLCLAKQSVEYVITGSPVAEPVVDESEVPPSKKKKRILYTSPHKKLSFSPVESVSSMAICSIDFSRFNALTFLQSSRDFVGFRSKDPVEVVQRQVKATGAASKRSTRAHSKAAE